MRNAQNETHEKVEARRPSRQLGLPVLLGSSGPPSAGVVFIEPFCLPLAFWRLF